MESKIGNMDGTEDNRIIKGDEIDLWALIKTLWRGRRIIAYSAAICLVIGLIVAYASPKKYTASATLLPSAEKKGGSFGGLSALAGMAGINIGSLMGDATGIPAELYPQVVGSVPYLMELMNEKLTWEKEGEMSLFEKAQRDSVPSSFDKVKKYTIGLPWALKDALLGKKQKNDMALSTNANTKGSEQIYTLSNLQRNVIGHLRQSVSISHDKKSGLVSLSVSEGEPLVAAQLANKAMTLLQKSIIDYKTKQSAENLRFIQERFVEAKVNYEQAQRSFFAYKDAHRNVVAERMDVEYQRLSDVYDIASAIFRGLAQQQEQAKIAVKEETPVFKVLDPVVVPKEKSAPKRGMIVVVSCFLGGVLGVAFLFFRMFWNDLLRERFL